MLGQHTEIEICKPEELRMTYAQVRQSIITHDCFMISC